MWKGRCKKLQDRFGKAKQEYWSKNLAGENRIGARSSCFNSILGIAERQFVATFQAYIEAKVLCQSMCVFVENVWK